MIQLLCVMLGLFVLSEAGWPPGRVFNLCPADGPSALSPLYIGNGSLICLAEDGIGTWQDGVCRYFSATRNSPASTPTPVCWVNTRDGLEWARTLDRPSWQAFVAMYVTDPGVPVQNHFVCLSRGLAGWTRFQGGNISECHLPNGQTTNNYELLRTTHKETPLWDQQMQPIDYPDPGGVALSEGLYTIANTADECWDMCHRVAQCGGIVWYRDNGWCWLKNKSTMDHVTPIIGPPTASFRSVRVSKVSYVPDIGSCTVISDIGRGQIVQDHFLGEIKGITGSQCCDECKGTSRCAGVSYLTYEWHCFLHSQVKGVPYLQIAGDSVVASL